MNKLKLLRLSKDLTQNQLASLSGVPQYLVSMIENGKYNATEEQLTKLSNVLTGHPTRIKGFLGEK